MSKYIPKEIVLNNLEIPEGVSILYSTWTIRDELNTIVHYTDRDDVNLTSKVFTDVFEIGKKYYVTMSMVRTDGPTIDTRPLEVLVFSGEDTYYLYPMPSVIDTPIITMAYAVDNVPSNNIKFTGSSMVVAGNATHDYSHWWLTNDTNEVIWDSGKDQLNKTEIILSNVDLKRDRFYTMHCVYTGTNRDSSGTGSITFRPNSFDELELAGDLNNTYYGYGIDTRLKELDSDMTLFEYKLLGDDVELYSDSNNTGEIEINSYYGGELIGSVLGNAVDNKYYIGGVRASNGKIYYAPYSANRVLKVDPVTGETTYIGIDLGTINSKYHGIGIEAPNGMIYFPPSNANKVLKVDPNTDTVTLIGTDYGSGITKYTSAILALNNKIYCVPSGPTTTQVLKIDPLTDTTTLIGTAINNGLAKYYNAILAPNNKIYATPRVTNQVLLLDPSTDTTSLIGADYGSVVDKYISITLGGNGKLYSLPYSASKALEIDPNTNTTRLLDSDYTSLGVYKYFASVLSNGKIYGVPADANKVLELDPVTGATNLIGTDLNTATYKYIAGARASNGKIYCTPFNANKVLEIDPIAGTTIQIGIDLGITGNKYSNLILYDNSLISSPALSSRRVFKFDLTKYEESKNSYLIESYSEYTLRLRMTTNSSVIGWKDIKFKPKQFKVESDTWDDIDFTYENRVEVLDGKILNYDKSNYNASFTTPNGKTYQLPNGEVILLRTKTKIGRFNIDEDNGVLTHLGDLYLPQVTLNKDYNVFNFKIFETGDVLIGVGYTDYTLYQFKYDPVNNRFIYNTKYSITNGGTNTYSEMHLVDSKVIFTTDGVIGTGTQDIYTIDLVKQLLELSISNVVSGSASGNLIRLDNDDLLLRGGVSKSNRGAIVNTGKLIHSTAGVLSSSIDSRISLPSVGISDESALQATLRNNELILGNFNQFSLKSNSRDEVRLVGIDLGATAGKFGAWLLAPNGCIYSLPAGATQVLKFNPTTGKSTLIGPILATTANKYIKGVITNAGVIYSAPYAGGSILKIDTNTDTVSILGSGYGIYDTQHIASNGMIYCTPVTATQVLKIDPTTDTISLIGTVFAATTKWNTSILALNGMIYAVPYGATQVLKINPNTDTTTLIGIDLGATNGKYQSEKLIELNNGVIYAPPAFSNKVLKIDTNTDTVSLIGTDYGTTISKYSTIELSNNGFLYCIPLSSSKVLKINPNTDTTSLIGIDLGAVTRKYGSIVKSDSGDIYASPLSSSKVLKIDPNTDTVSLVGIDLGTTPDKFGVTIIVPSGKIYASPISASKVLEIDPDGISNNTFTLKKLPADKNTMTDTSPFIFKSNGGEDFKFTIFLNNGKRIFMSHSKDKPKMIVYK